MGIGNSTAPRLMVRVGPKKTLRSKPICNTLRTTGFVAHATGLGLLEDLVAYIIGMTLKRVYGPYTALGL